jgi:hypothetical protein
MAYGIYDFDVEQGTTFGLDVTFNDEAGTLRQLANYEARIDIRTYRGAPTATDTWNTGEEITVYDTAPNLRLTVPASKTATYAVGSYDYDLEIELSGVVEKLLQGKIRITGEATR